jgi:hypothetical protein
LNNQSGAAKIINRWTSKKVTDLWSKVWEKLHPFLQSTSNQTKQGLDNNNAAQTNVTSTNKDKSRTGQIVWRTCYNNMCKAEFFKGNKKRKKVT